MKILKLAAVAVTALFALMNLGVVPDGEVETAYRVLGLLLALLGLVAAVGLATNRPWGRSAVIAVGALNVLTAVSGFFTDQEGAVIGIVAGGLGMVLGALAADDPKQAATA